MQGMSFSVVEYVLFNLDLTPPVPQQFCFTWAAVHHTPHTPH